MKRKIGICLLVFVFLFLVAFGAGIFFTDEPKQESRIKEQTAQETETEESIASSKTEDPYHYVVFSEDGKLVVYLSDGTPLFNSGVAEELLPEVWRNALVPGLRFRTQEELFEFLEAYSS